MVTFECAVTLLDKRQRCMIGLMTPKAVCEADCGQHSVYVCQIELTVKPLNTGHKAREQRSC